MNLSNMNVCCHDTYTDYTYNSSGTHLLTLPTSKRALHTFCDNGSQYDQIDLWTEIPSQYDQLRVYQSSSWGSGYVRFEESANVSHHQYVLRIYTISNTPVYIRLFH